MLEIRGKILSKNKSNKRPKRGSAARSKKSERVGKAPNKNSRRSGRNNSQTEAKSSRNAPANKVRNSQRSSTKSAAVTVKPASESSGANKPKLHDSPVFIEIDEEHNGQRVDNYLIAYLKGVPKTHIYRIIRKGEVRVNKGRVKQTTRLVEGDSIRIPPIRLSDASNTVVDGARYEFLRKSVLFEDGALLIINKPSGMAVHAGSGIKVGIIEALRALRTDIKYLELVHRLDRETSGCLVLAKKSSALKLLQEDFKNNSLKNNRLDKRYLALVKGGWKYGQRRITKSLNTDARRHGERHVVVDENGSYASSIATPIDTSSVASLLEVKLLTGRTHQVRVHVLSEGHPIGGDSRYGDKQFNSTMKQAGLSRLFLHACKLSFTHPLTAEMMTVNAPLPTDLKRVLDALDLCIN